MQAAESRPVIEIHPGKLVTAGALTVAAAMLGLAWSLDPAFAVFWAFGLAFGFVLQRSRFCFHRAYRELFAREFGPMTRAILVGLAVTTIGFAWVMYGRIDDPLAGFRPIEAHIVPLGLNIVLGGFVFGLGMMLSRGCLSRSMCHMGEGYVASWVTVGAVLLGLTLAAHSWNWFWVHDMGARDLVWLPNRMGYSMALALTVSSLVALWFVLRWWGSAGAAASRAVASSADVASLSRTARDRSSSRAESRLASSRPAAAGQTDGSLNRSSIRDRLFDGPWPAVTGGVALALLNIGLYHFYQPWGMTGELSRWADGIAGLFGLSAGPLLGVEWLPLSCSLSDGTGQLLTKGLMLNVGLVLGAFIAASASGEFRVRTSGRAYYAQSAAGGVLMGLGAGLAVGCTIGGLFSAIPSLALNGWVFGAALTVGAFVGWWVVERL